MPKMSIKDKIRQRAKENKKSQGSGTFNVPNFNAEDMLYKPKGEAVFDILNYTITDPKHPDQLEVGDEWYRRPYKSHFLKVDGKTKMYICRRSINEKCPICEYYTKLMKNGLEQEAAQLKAKDRELYNVVDPKEGKVRLFDFSYFNFGKQLDNDLADDHIGEEYGDFSNIEDGYTLRVRFEKASFGGNSFLQANRIDFMKRKKPISKEVKRQIYNLDELLVILPYEKLEKIMLNLADEVPEEEEGAGEDINDSQWEEEKSAPKDKDPEPDPKEVEEGTPEGECPNGYTFGEDCDKQDECEPCPVWTECADEKEKIMEKKRLKRNKKR